MKKERIIAITKTAMRISFIHALLISIGTLSTYAHTAEAQGALKRTINITNSSTTIKSFLEDLERQSNVKFVYSPSGIKANRQITIPDKSKDLASVLNEVLIPMDIEYKVQGEKILLIKNRQEMEISGTINDAGDNLPLPGVSVMVKGTSNGTLTNDAGQFTLTVNTNDILVISFIGYTTQEIRVAGSQQVYNITLQPSTSNLDEVIVTGYSSQRKKDLTGAVSVVNVSEMNKQPTGQISNQLQGQASGVTVIGSGQPGREPQVRIRGLNTFGNNSPLYVVDGVPIQNIADLNPNDIAQMQVLKDAGSASIYGSRAANGVIIVTTKRGVSDGVNEGKVRIDYDMFYGTQRPISGNIWDIASPMDNAKLTFMAQRNSDVTPGNDLYGKGDQPVLPDYIAPKGAMEGDPSVNPDKYNINPDYFDGKLDGFYRITRANKAGTDWADEIFQNAPITSHNLAVSNGSEKGSYLFSFNYFNQEGVLMNTYLKRYTLRANASYNLGEHVRIGQNLSYSIRNSPQSSERTLDGALANDGIGELDEGNAIGMSFREAPIIPVYDIMGNFAGSSGGDMGNARNPVAIQDRIKDNRSQMGRLMGNMYLEADILNHITLRSSFGGEINSGFSHRFAYPEYENAENNTVNTYTENAINSWNWTWTNTATYKQNFNDLHDLTVIVGTESFQERYRFMEGTTQGYFSFNPDFVDLGTGFGNQTARTVRDASTLFSYIGRADYNFKQRYLLGVTIRRDASSKFLNHQSGWFPAVSAGWRVTEEDFMANRGKWLTDLKIRGGYGIMGNQLNVNSRNSYNTFSGVRRGSYYDIPGSGNSTVLGIQPFRIGNPDAKWEKNINFNVGLDATLFSKLEISADYYSKTIDDLLYNPELPGTAGRALAPYVNVAKMKNTGIDIALSGRFDLGSDLKLNATGTITTYKNEIQEVSQASDYFDVRATEYRYNGNFVVRNSVGNPMGSFFGYKIDGFWNSQQEIDAANASARQITGNDEATYQNAAGVGRFKYADVDGDGLITADDRTVLGNPNPKLNYGLNLGLTFKNWDFSAFIYGVAGNDIWNNVRWYTDFYSSFNGSANSNTAVHNSWTPENMNAKAPIQEIDGYSSTKNVPNSYFVEQGGYLRLRNASIGYTLPKEWVSNAKIERLRVYIQAANLFTITKYSGPDPEISGGTTSFGIDQGTYITPRQFLIGLSVGF